MRGVLLICESLQTLFSTVDMDLIMSEKHIGYPKPKIVKVDMADRDGALDMSDSIRGRVSYSNRTLSFTFTCTAPQSEWADIRDFFAIAIHGQMVALLEPDTPNHAYIGRCEMGDPTYIGDAIMFLHMTMDAEPYRINLSTRTINASATAGSTVTITNEGTMPVSPTIKASADMTIKFGDYSVALTGGTSYDIPEIILEFGDNVFNIVSGSGTLTFTFNEGVI